MDLINQMPVFSLFFVRILSMFLIVPVFNGRGVPAMFRIGTAFFIAVAAYGSLASAGEAIVPLGTEYIILVVKEVLIGLMMGFLVLLFISALQVAGQFIDVQMGFGLANVVDPQTGTQVPIMGFFKYYLGMLIFLSLDIHHYIIHAYVESFQQIPVGHLHLNGRYAEFVVSAFSGMFVIALKIAAPVVFCLLLTTVALGITARTVPQMNVFVVGMPLKIGLGFIVTYLSLPTFLFVLDALFTEMLESLYIMVNLIANSRP